MCAELVTVVTNQYTLFLIWMYVWTLTKLSHSRTRR